MKWLGKDYILWQNDIFNQNVLNRHGFSFRFIKHIVDIQCIPLDVVFNFVIYQINGRGYELIQMVDLFFFPENNMDFWNVHVNKPEVLYKKLVLWPIKNKSINLALKFQFKCWNDYLCAILKIDNSSNIFFWILKFYFITFSIYVQKSHYSCPILYHYT